MFDFINEHLGIIVCGSIVLAKLMLGVYIFDQSDRSSRDRWATWVAKLIGFVTAIVVLIAAPFIVLAVQQNWNGSPEDQPLYAFLLTVTTLALIASFVHVLGFPVSTYRMFRPQQI